METGLGLASRPAGRPRIIGLFSGFLAGLLGAIVARLLMRVVAVLTFGFGSFSIEGTANILLAGVLVGPLLGLIYQATAFRLRAPALAQGLLFGLGLLVVLQVPILLIVPDFKDELLAAGPIGLPVFAVMNLIFVLILAVLTAWVAAWWPRQPVRRELQTGLTVAFGLLALAGLAVLVVQLGGRLLGMRM